MYTNHHNVYIIWYSNEDLYAQKVVMSQDNPIVWDSEGIAICDANSQQTGARLTTDNQGGVYITWEDTRSEDSSNVYLQRINSNNQISFDANGLVVSDANLNQQSAVVRASNTGNVFVLWEDRRVGSPGIYVQNIDSSGNLNMIENGLEIFYGVDGTVEILNVESNEMLILSKHKKIISSNNGTILSKEIDNKDLSYLKQIQQESGIDLEEIENLDDDSGSGTLNESDLNTVQELVINLTNPSGENKKLLIKFIQE